MWLLLFFPVLFLYACGDIAFVEHASSLSAQRVARTREGLGLRITCILFHTETKHALDHNINIILAANIIPQHCTLLVFLTSYHAFANNSKMANGIERETNDAMRQERKGCDDAGRRN